jgi:mono/diheme cytochrome c family protein
MEKLMLKNLFLGVLGAAVATSVFAAAATLAGVARADQFSAKAVTVQVEKTAPTSGKAMYGSYCASCHGVTGKGNGAKAAGLKTQPADLTVLSKNYGGKFPSAHIASVLQFGVENPSHGTAEMPVWGPVLGKMDQANPQDRQLRIRI